MHYVSGNSSIYSISDWINFYIKFKTLQDIPLFKNYRNAKLFQLWRRYLKKTNKTLYMEKLKKKFHHIDPHLLNGIMEIRKILKEMTEINIFLLDNKEALTINTFEDMHQKRLRELERALLIIRHKVKKETAKSCDDSYQAYKELKKITLDETNTNKDKAQDMINKIKQVDEDSLGQNFLKDDLPYAQDATRR
jgi:hypothetical protein